MQICIEKGFKYDGRSSHIGTILITLQQEHTSPAAKCPRLSVNDDNQSADTKNRNSKEKDVYFLKFLLCFNIDFKKINSAHCQNMLKTLDPTYTIPSIEDLTNRVLDYAIQKMNEEKIQDLTSTMGMATIGIDNEIIAISFAIHSNNKYFYIDNITICKDDVDYIKQLDVFCNLSVEMAKKVYNVSVKFVLYDGSVRISCMGIANNSKYYTITTFSQIISELKYNHDPFLVANSSDTEKVKQYDNVLESFEKKLTTANYTIADATEDLLYLVSNESLSINKSMDKTIIELLSPVSLAANYFMHEFKGHHFIDYKPLKDMMYEFLFDAVPNEAFDSLTEFKDQTGIFQELNNQQKFKFTRGRFLAHC
ncbi:uncharacterized protein LOC100678820 isoform X2 [Nasonia vitripennis]|uniref:Uncharacterized protein n=1 Tax=Nasonia vitripennis TaxID=7425 RepID=A0A7M7HA90_NASVI|nr:uncharacterized protein LOC100678820 isoform X2 [Nasonia vitripennis]